MRRAGPGARTGARGAALAAARARRGGAVFVRWGGGGLRAGEGAAAAGFVDEDVAAPAGLASLAFLLGRGGVGGLRVLGGTVAGLG